MTHKFRLDRFSFHHLHLFHKRDGLAALTTNRMIATAAWSVIGVFFPIFLFEYFGSLTLVLVWYLISYGLRIPLQPIVAKVFARIGLLPSMFIGQIGICFFFIALYLLEVQAPISEMFLLGLSIFGLLVVATFYWSPFHIDMATLSTKGKVGRQVSMRYSIQRLIGVLMPIGSGAIILYYGYHINFILSLFLLIASMVPLFFLRNKYVRYEFGFFETFQKMFSKKFREMSVSMVAYGAENVVGVIIWPLFLYMIFEGDYLNIGAFTAVVVVISVLLEIFVGRETDKWSAKKMMKIGTGVYALGWLGKAIVDTVIGVFAASTFHSIGSILLRTPVDALMYEQAADAGHYIDEYTTIREIALNIGRASMIVILIGLTYWFPLSSSFLVAAVVGVGVLRLARQAMIRD